MSNHVRVKIGIIPATNTNRFEIRSKGRYSDITIIQIWAYQPHSTLPKGKPQLC